MDKYKFIISIISGSLIGLFGGVDSLFKLLLILIASDFVLGELMCICKVSPKSENGGFNSKIGYKGLIKKVGYLLLVIIANQCDIAFNLSIIRSSVIMACAINEITSIAENMDSLGFKVPTILIDTIKKGNIN